VLGGDQRPPRSLDSAHELGCRAASPIRADKTAAAMAALNLDGGVEEAGARPALAASLAHSRRKVSCHAVLTLLESV
jgi:hypothetical protein